MCIAPVTVYNRLANGQFQTVETACHECWQCRENSINDWVGRNIAESKTATWSRAITLTYGRNALNEVLHERAVLLTYSDVQKYLKLLRRHGFPVRYFITGEYGSKWGRAHWHVMLYGQGKMPPHELDANFMHYRIDPETGEIAKDNHTGKDALWWPHGWSFWTNPTHAAVRYNCKYIQKDMGDDERQGHLAMSKKPPIGSAYFSGLADRYVSQGLSPQSLDYSFPEVVRRKKQDRSGGHEIVNFRLKDTSAKMFVERFIVRWIAVHGHDRWPNSELIDGYYEYGRIVDEYRATIARVAGMPSAWRDVLAARAAKEATPQGLAEARAAKLRWAEAKADWWYDMAIKSDREGGLREPAKRFIEQYEYERAEYERRQQFRQAVPDFRDYA